jgi:hypothetical protein
VRGASCDLDVSQNNPGEKTLDFEFKKSGESIGFIGHLCSKTKTQSTLEEEALRGSTSPIHFPFGLVLARTRCPRSVLCFCQLMRDARLSM